MENSRTVAVLFSGCWRKCLSETGESLWDRAHKVSSSKQFYWVRLRMWGSWPRCGLGTRLALPTSSLGEWPGTGLASLLGRFRTNCIFLSVRVEHIHRWKRKMGAGYVSVCVLCVVRQEASESLGVREIEAQVISLPGNHLAHGLHPVRVLDSVQSLESRTGTSSGPTVERILCPCCPPPCPRGPSHSLFVLE